MWDRKTRFGLYGNRDFTIELWARKDADSSPHAVLAGWGGAETEGGIQFPWSEFESAQDGKWHYFNGAIAAIRVHKGALTPEQVAANAAQTPKDFPPIEAEKKLVIDLDASKLTAGSPFTKWENECSAAIATLPGCRMTVGGEFATRLGESNLLQGGIARIRAWNHAQSDEEIRARAKGLLQREIRATRSRDADVVE